MGDVIHPLLRKSGSETIIASIADKLIFNCVHLKQFNLSLSYLTVAAILHSKMTQVFCNDLFVNG